MTLILTDFHHHALAESLMMLFADRKILGPTAVYFPYGMAWFNEGIWQFEKKHHGDAVAQQYLTGVWQQGHVQSDGGMTLRRDPRHPGRTLVGMSLESARNQKWDFVISSLPDNDEGFYTLAKQTGAKFGVQVGNNVQQSRWDLADFILSSSTLPDEGLIDQSLWGKVITAHGKPCVIYHQEFSLETFRYEWPPAERRTVASFVNCFPEGPSYPQFQAFARLNAAEFDFKVYGAYGTGADDEFKAGDLATTPLVGDAMRTARIGWHSKHWSDGFGHVVHNWFAIGRPVVGIPRYYADKLAGPLFVEGVTSFNIESRSPAELAAVLRRLRDDDDYHRSICENSAARFRELVDFDGEAAAIAEMLS